MKQSLIICTLFFLCVNTVLAAAQEYDENNDGVTDKWIVFGSNGTRRIEVDRDYNGVADYAVVYDRDANIKEEHIDFNNDGYMDDFYYYTNGVLTRREVDSNYDTVIDIWVYLREGVYIEKYEMDTDFDGEIDTIKDYTAQ
ncbi:MAG: hypothetical protein JXB03_06240 [Spirochaetales bacterium]|nr:hypothetical protein [Spirochaetales bacterium]